MAVKAVTIDPDSGQAKLVTWEAGVDGDTGAPVEVPGASALAGAVQMTGTPGTTTMQVSNDGTNWVTLKDLGHADIALTSAGMAEFTTAARYIRPSFGTSASACVVTLMLRG